MKPNELAKLLDVKPLQISDKARSTNKITSVMTLALLEMPQELAEPFIATALAKFAEVEDRANARREQASERAKSIK